MSKPDKLPPRPHDLLLRSISSFRREGYTPQYNLVLRDIADQMNRLTKITYVGVARISTRTWISENQVRKIVGQLERDGFLRVTRRDHRTSIYEVIIPAAEELRSESTVSTSPNTAPTSPDMADYSESTQTGLLTSHLNLSRKPDGAAPAKLGRVPALIVSIPALLMTSQVIEPI